MRSIAVLLSVFLGLASTHAPAQRGKRTLDLCILTDARGKDYVEPLTEKLARRKWSMIATTELGEAIASKADVLIVVIPSTPGPELDKKSIAALRNRRMVAIGEGAAELFDRLGLNIGLRQAATDIDRLAPRIRLVKSGLLKRPGSDKLFPVYRTKAKRSFNLTLSLYVPPQSHLLRAIDVIARHENELYVPIALQGNHLFVGPASSPGCWSKAFDKLFVSLVGELKKRRVKPFTPVAWPIAKPGKYEFKLDRRCPTKTFFFKFTKPTTFEAVFEHRNGNSVFLVFEGAVLWSRKDPPSRQPEKIRLAITKKEIERMGDGYWKLGITNIGESAPAKCVLELSY